MHKDENALLIDVYTLSPGIYTDLTLNLATARTLERAGLITLTINTGRTGDLYVCRVTEKGHAEAGRLMATGQ